MTRIKMKTSEMKKEVCNLLNRAYGLKKFRTFAASFRKHVDETFDYRMSQVYVGMTFAEHASYIIGDGNYDITPEQFEALRADLNAKLR